MKNREITYYSLLNRENLRHIEHMADTTEPETFIALGFENKWLPHLWIEPNNESFLAEIGNFQDLQKLDWHLSGQLREYARKQGEGFEKDKGDFYRVYKARKDWLRHTIFICKNEYRKTKNEIFNETVKWCEEWENEWLETFNPYSPIELKEMVKDLKIPLWKHLDQDLPPKQFENEAEQAIKLQLIFDSISKYKYIMELLVTEGYIQPNTYIWIDNGKGNKAFLAALLKYLHSQGYYKENKKPSNIQIQAIVKNTFGWEIGIDTINRANPVNFNFDFIPPASTVQ